MADAEADLTALAEELAAAGARIEPALDALYPLGQDDFLTEPFRHHMATGGKRVRPALCLLTCEALGGDGDRAIPFAAAVEVLHNMLLVHDDLEDGDTVRRDAPAVWVKYGAPNAINLGDDMLARAYMLIVRSPAAPRTVVRLVEAFTDALERTCRGQALDLNLRGREGFTVDSYLEMVTLKTGHYLALGMVGGAVIAGAGAKAIARIRELGASMGPAFQIRDDLIDLTAGKGRSGVLGNDIREGKPSILYAHALQASCGADRNRLLRIMRRSRQETSDADVLWVIDLYRRCGSLEFARTAADGLVQRALDSIDRLAVRNKEFFRRVARFMAERAN